MLGKCIAARPAQREFSAPSFDRLFVAEAELRIEWPAHAGGIELNGCDSPRIGKFQSSLDQFAGVSTPAIVLIRQNHAYPGELGAMGEKRGRSCYASFRFQQETAVRG